MVELLVEVADEEVGEGAKGFCHEEEDDARDWHGFRCETWTFFEDNIYVFWWDVS